MNEPYVRPDVRAFLDLLAASPRPVFSDQVIAAMRRMPAEEMASADLPAGELAVQQDMQVPGDGGPITVRLFDARAGRPPGPVVIFYHGGGFVVGNIATHAGLAAEIARGLDMPVLSVEYRLAPEHRWPAAPDDAEAVARWAAANGALGREFTSLILCGDSAGGNLAIVTALALRDAPAALPVALLWAIYPVADLRDAPEPPYESQHRFADGYGLASTDAIYFHQAYAPQRDHWRASPLLADLVGLPPVLAITASLDPLRDQGRRFAAAAINAGVNVTYREYAGTIHGFASYRAAIPSAQEDTLEMIATAAGLVGPA